MSCVRRMVSRRQERDGQGTRMPEQRTAMVRKQHLYLAFDDWDSGYTISKVHLSPPGEGQGSGEGRKKQRLRNVIMRVSAPRGFAEYFTAAFGTKILVLHPGPVDITQGIPIIYVKDRSFTSGPVSNFPSCPIYFPVGDDRLFALDIGSFECLSKPERSGLWVWHSLPYPPFMMVDVSSYAVRPDGFILVSTKNHATGCMTTFIFDTEEYVWKPYSDLVFPFTSRGHYDPFLEAFVGLSKDPESFGYLYSCTMASTGTGDTSTRLHCSLDSKCSKETLYSKNPAERHVSATLVHMCAGKFCLVECISINGFGADQELREPEGDHELRGPGVHQVRLKPQVIDQMLWDQQEEYSEESEPEEEILEVDDAPGSVPQCGCFMYRVKTFSLSYDANGDLMLKHGQVHLCRLPHEASTDFIQKNPVAFWL